MVELSRKIVLTAGAAFFAASAFGQVPTRDINVQTGQAAGQSTNFNLQILEEVDALRREITELRETIDQQRYETGQLRRDNAQAIAELQRELDYRTTQSPAPAGLDGEFAGEQGSGSTAFAVGGGGVGDPGSGGVSSAPPAGSPPQASTIDADTEEILSNLYDGAVPESGAGSTNPAAVIGDASPPAGIAGPEQAQLRAEQAQFRAEQAQLLEAQARFLQEQARFRQEQSQFLQQQAGGEAAPRAAPQGQMPGPQSIQQPGVQQGQQQGQPPVPAPDQGAVVLPGIDDAAGTELRIGPAPIVAGTISMDQGPNPEPAGDSAPYVPADIAIPAEPSLEMVIIANEPAPLDEFAPTATTARTTQNEPVNPFDLNEATSTERGASVSGGIYSSSLDENQPRPGYSPVEGAGASVLAQRSLVTTQPNTIFEVDIPQPPDGDDSTTTIEPNAIGSSALPSAERFGFSTTESGSAFGPELATRSSPGEARFAVEDDTGEEVMIQLATAASTDTFGAGGDFDASQVPGDAPPEPIPELPSRQDPEPQVVVLASPESPPPFTPAAQPRPEPASRITPNRVPEPQVVTLASPESPPPMTTPPSGQFSRQDNQVAAAQPEPATPVSLNSEEARMYNKAFASYQNRKWSRAIKEFKKQLKEYPNGSLAADAHYWSGEALFVTRSMIPAQQHMETILLEYGGSARAPDAMLKLAMIRKGQGQKDDASRIYRELIDRFPGTQAAMAAQNNLASNR